MRASSCETFSGWCRSSCRSRRCPLPGGHGVPRVSPQPCGRSSRGRRSSSPRRSWRPWVLADEASAEVVAQVVERCPSGALQYRRLDGGPQEKVGPGTKVTPVRDGPLLVTGRIEVTREDGAVETMPRATLCRCGHSEHAPFCDNTHLAINFRAPGRPYKLHLSEVRVRLDRPITKTEDPRRID